MTDKLRIEIHNINGDIYINGEKKIFTVDFNNPPKINPTQENVDWLIGWAKIGLLSHGHDVPHFEMKPHDEFKEGDEDAKNEISSKD